MIKYMKITFYLLLCFMSFANVDKVYSLNPETEFLLQLLEKNNLISKEDGTQLRTEIQDYYQEKGLAELPDKETLKMQIKKELKEEQAYSLNNLKFAGIDIHGFISQGYLYTNSYNYLAADSSNGTFAFNEIGINFTKDVTDNLRIGTQFTSRDLGHIGNNEIEIDWAFGDYSWKDWLGIRAGILKTSYGLYNTTREIDALRTSVILPQGVYNEGFRDTFTNLLGGGLYGNISMNNLGSLSYIAQVGTKNFNSNGGTARYFISELGSGTDYKEGSFGTFLNGHIVYDTPLEGLRVAGSLLTVDEIRSEFEVSYAKIPARMDVDDLYCCALSLEYVVGDFVLSSEMSAARGGTTFTMSSTPTQYSNIDITGWYVMGTYRFNEWLELGSYYNESYYDLSDSNGTNARKAGHEGYSVWQKDLALFSRFDINEYWIAKVEAHFINGTGGLFTTDNNDGEREQDWLLLTGKVTFNF